MPITIHRVEPKPQANRQNGYERKVRELMPLFLHMQAEGLINASQIARVLAKRGVLTPQGKAYSESVIFGMLRRGKQMGFPIVRRTRSEAAGAWGRGPRPPKNKKPCP